MDLLIDVGNTRAKMAVAEGVRLKDIQPLSQEAIGDAMERFAIGRVIASVVGPMPNFETLIPEELLCKLHLLSAQSPLPIRLEYVTPQTLGADRIASVVGARALYGDRALLVVDAGSCITLDYIDASGVYHGGAIMPGIGMKFKAMNTFTEKLPLLDNVCVTPNLVGGSTEESMRSGVIRGTVFELEGFLRAYKDMNPSVRMILTGGDADQLVSAMDEEVEVEQDLVWRGLCEILKNL